MLHITFQFLLLFLYVFEIYLNFLCKCSSLLLTIIVGISLVHFQVAGTYEASNYLLPQNNIVMDISTPVISCMCLFIASS